MPEQGEQETVRVVALDRSFHVSCYKCEVNNYYYYYYEMAVEPEKNNIKFFSGLRFSIIKRSTRKGLLPVGRSRTLQIV
mgnify:CR=1 FL=1